MLTKYIKKAFLTVCLFLCHSFSGDLLLSQDNPSSTYYAILKGELDKSISPSTAFEAYTFMYQSTLQHILLETISLDEYESRFDLALPIIQTLADDSPKKLFYEAEIRLFCGLVYFKNKKQIDASWQIRKSFRQSNENTTKYPEFTPSLKTLGFLQIALGAVPEKYHWLLSLVGLNGSVPLGITNLEEVITKNTTYALESSYLLALAHTYLIGDAKTGSELMSEIEDVNALSALLKMSTWSKNNESEKTITLFENSIDSTFFPQAYYLAAEAYLQKGQYDTAINTYHEFLERLNGEANKKDVYFKMALCHQFSREFDQANKYKALAEDEQAVTAADRNANQLLEKWDVLNFEILKLRLATDGGFYTQAKTIVEQVYASNKMDSVELIYRQARLNHKTENLKLAFVQYQQTIDKSAGEKWYFAPNSALNLAYIAEQSENYDAALDYFSLAKSYKHHIYKNSIDSKAEAGINRLKDHLDD